MNNPRLRRDQVTERIRRIVATDAFVVGVNFQHVLWTIRIPLQRRKAIEQRRPLITLRHSPAPDVALFFGVVRRKI
jgi:hypothetical protein